MKKIKKHKWHFFHKWRLFKHKTDQVFVKIFKCAVCGKHQSEIKQALCVDHNHINNNVRGLLCIRCNRAIGMLEDNVQLLSQAINYLTNS